MKKQLVLTGIVLTVLACTSCNNEVVTESQSEFIPQKDRTLSETNLKEFRAIDNRIDE